MPGKKQQKLITPLERRLLRKLKESDRKAEKKKKVMEAIKKYQTKNTKASSAPAVRMKMVFGRSDYSPRLVAIDQTTGRRIFETWRATDARTDKPFFKTIFYHLDGTTEERKSTLAEIILYKKNKIDHDGPDPYWKREHSSPKNRR